jgi:hypothetical protein
VTFGGLADDGGAAGGCNVVHPAAASSHAAVNRAPAVRTAGDVPIFDLLPTEQNRMDAGFALLLIEAALALGLLVFIVWWTLPKKRRDQTDTPPDQP